MKIVLHIFIIVKEINLLLAFQRVSTSLTLPGPTTAMLKKNFTVIQVINQLLTLVIRHERHQSLE